jgi:hypothetical protein
VFRHCEERSNLLAVVAVMKLNELKFVLYVIARNEAISLYFMGAMKNEDSNLREDCLENPLMIFLKKEHFYRGFLAMTALERVPSLRGTKQSPCRLSLS